MILKLIHLCLEGKNHPVENLPGVFTKLAEMQEWNPFSRYRPACLCLSHTHTCISFRPPLWTPFLNRELSIFSV